LFDILASEIVENYPQHTTFAGVCSSSEIGRGYCQFVRDAFEAAGLEFVGERIVPPEATDFNAVLTELKSSEPAIVMALLDGGPATFTFLRQATELDVGEMFTIPAVPYDLLEGLAGEGIRDKTILAGANPRTELLPTDPEAAAFFEDVYRPFAGGALPLGAGVTLTTYDAVYMLVAAMQEAGSVDDTDAIAAALERVSFDGVGENDLTFDASHIMVAGADLCTIRDGGYQECHHIRAR
jgi:branched-chain amino acid transport system substrate-binding protein